MLKANLTEALYTVATAMDPNQRLKAEEYVNSVIDNTKYLHEITGVIVEMFGEPKLNTLLIILLKKMVKGYKELDEAEMHKIMNLLFQSASRVNANNIKLYAELIVDYIYEVLGLADAYVFGTMNNIATDFIKNFNSFTKDSYFEVILLNRFCRKGLAVKMTRHYLFNDFKDMYEETFKRYIDITIPNDKTRLMNFESIYVNFMKLMNNLSHIYDDYTYLGGLYNCFEYLTINIFKDYSFINNTVQNILKTQFKCLESSYMTLSMKSNIFERLTSLLLEIFFNIDNYTTLGLLSQYDLDFFYLKYFVNILDDFLNEDDTGISALSENHPTLGLQSYVQSKIQIYPAIIDKIISTFIAKEINSILSGEIEELAVYFNVKSKQFKEDEMVCALKLLSILFEFYLFNNENYVESLVQELLHQLEIDARNETEFCNHPYNFYKLSFLQENMHRINKLVNVSPIVSTFLNYDPMNLNFFIMYFLEAYFFEYEIDESLLIKGLGFAIKTMDNDNLNLALIATNIALLIINKSGLVSHKDELLNINNFLSRFLVIFQTLTNERSGYVMQLLDIFIEVIEIIDIDRKVLEIILNFLFNIITMEVNPNYLTMVLKSTEVFTDVFIKASSDALTYDVIAGVGKLITIQITKFLQTQQTIYLESVGNLLLGYIGKFEVVCDQAITQVLNKNTQVLANFIEISNCFIEVVKAGFYNLIDYYTEDMKYNFILLLFVLLANSFSKIYFIINHNNFIFNFTPGSSSYYIDIKTDNYKNVLGKKVKNKSQIEVIVPLSKIGESAFIQDYLYILKQYMQKLYLSVNLDELNNCFDILDFVCMLFPFLNIQIYEFVFELFNKINDEVKLIDSINRNHLFLGINRIISRIILTYPSFLLNHRQRNFSNIISYLKVIIYSGK